MDQWASCIKKFNGSPSLNEWLLDPASTTKKFAQLNLKASYQLLDQTTVAVDRSVIDEYIPLSSNKKALISRHIQIDINQKLFMIASSLIQCSEAFSIKINSLGNNPIGPLLFSSPDIQRSKFEFINHLASMQKSIPSTNPNQFVARRSFFKGTKLNCLLIESFQKKHPIFEELDYG